MQVTHIVTDSGDLSRWLQKGGEFRAKLNGIGFALPIDITLDDKHQLQIRDVSYQTTMLSLPGKKMEIFLPIYRRKSNRSKIR